MTLLTIIAVIIALGIWGLYIRLGGLWTVFEEAKLSRESLKAEMRILWVAISSEPANRAQRREKFGLHPLYVGDVVLSKGLDLKVAAYDHFQEEYDELEKKQRSYSDKEIRDQQKQRMEEIKLILGMNNSFATEEQQAAWDKKHTEHLDRLFNRSKTGVS